MGAVMQWGLLVIERIQNIASPWFTALMIMLTHTGSEYFYALCVCVVLWCIHERRALYLSTLLLISAFINFWLKAVFALPRPGDLYPALALIQETNYGLPSGHAQTAALFWLWLAVKLRHTRYKLPLFFAAALMPLAISFTRVYLGVHFPTDVFAGLALGVCIAAAGLLAEPAFVYYSERLHPRFVCIGAAFIAFGMNALLPQHTHIAGMFVGMFAGAFLLAQRSGYTASSGSLRQKTLRCLVGAGGLAFIVLGFKLFEPSQAEKLYPLMRFIRYAVTGLWVFGAAPVLFIRLGLAQAETARR